MHFCKSILWRIISVSLFILVVLTPLLYLPTLTSPFELPKFVLVVFWSFFAFFLYLFGLVWGCFETPKIPRSLFLVGLTQTLATLLSPYVHTAFWGYFPRFYDGLVFTLGCVFLFMVASNVFTRRQLFYLLNLGFLITLPILSALSICQHFGLFGFEPVPRVFALVGQPNWLAAFFVFGLFFSFTVRSVGIRILLVLSSLVGLWFTYSLSGLVALLVGFLFLLLVSRSRRLGLNFLVFLCASLLLFRLSPFWSGRIHDGLVSLYPSEQVSTYAFSDPGDIRICLWRGSLARYIHSGWRFLFGFGPGTFAYVFPATRPNCMNYVSEWYYIMNKPHNYFIELLLTVGIFGLFAFLWFLYDACLRLPKKFRPMLVAYLVTLLFGWPSAEGSVYFWLLLAYAFAE